MNATELIETALQSGQLVFHVRAKRRSQLDVMAGKLQLHVIAPRMS
jgi:hypothetical protein